MERSGRDRAEVNRTVHRANTVHRVFGGEAAYRFLPPFFFPPLADFFAIAPYPSLRSWVLRGLSPRGSAAALWHASLRYRRPSHRWATPAALREVRI